MADVLLLLASLVGAVVGLLGQAWTALLRALLAVVRRLDEALDSDNFEQQVTREPPAPIDGYLVASQASPEPSFKNSTPGASFKAKAAGNASFTSAGEASFKSSGSRAAPDDFADLDGPPSTDSEDEEEDVVGALTSVSFANGKRHQREASFRKRTDEKIERAKIISSSLTSHLVTPSIQPRRIAVPAQPAGSRTDVIAPRTISANKDPLKAPLSRDGLPVSPFNTAVKSEGVPMRRRPTDGSKKRESLDSLSVLASSR